MPDPSLSPVSPTTIREALGAFAEFGAQTVVGAVDGMAGVPVFTNEFWTSKQRAANSLHEISYRACFKPQLPRFFIDRLTAPGAVVADPFMGRGTTLLEAALRGRTPFGRDANPLCARLIAPRLSPPTVAEVARRLGEIDFEAASGPLPADLLTFYHPRTLRQINALRTRLNAGGPLDPIDAWIQMVALNRLTGHSPGFFSVYTLPPNQAVSVASQRRINAQRNQEPPFRDVPALILKKTRQLLRDVTDPVRATLGQAAAGARLGIGHADALAGIPDASVDLFVTSPPFLDVVDYATDNWLRGWFVGIDVSALALSVPRAVTDWQADMAGALREIHRTLRPGGWAAFEVGEVRKGRVRLETAVLAAGLEAELEPILVLINAQRFTKTAQCWGVDNNAAGTNTNRVVLFQKATRAEPRRPGGTD